MTEAVNHIRENPDDVPPFSEQQAKEQLAYDYRDQVARLSFGVERYDEEHRYDGAVHINIGDRRNVDGFYFEESDSDGA